jgi:4-amino-4-deoxychorismate lyase
MNTISQRWATTRGYDDVLWVSSDGYALEAPTSTLLWQVEDRLLTTPISTGVLAGTTGRFLLNHAGDLGLQAGEKLITPAELTKAEGVWLTSSVRGVAEVRAVDGTRRSHSTLTGALQALAGYPTG